VKITAGGAIEKEAVRRFVDDWHRAERGESFREPNLAFESWDSLSRVLTGKRMELLRYVHRHKVPAIRVLAKKLGRAYTNVHADIQALAAVGVRDISEGDVRADYDAVETKITIGLFRESDHHYSRDPEAVSPWRICAGEFWGRFPRRINSPDGTPLSGAPSSLYPTDPRCLLIQADPARHLKVYFLVFFDREIVFAGAPHVVLAGTAILESLLGRQGAKSLHRKVVPRGHLPIPFNGSWKRQNPGICGRVGRSGTATWRYCGIWVIHPWA
jgi:predicted transcriptional regulator